MGTWLDGKLVSGSQPSNQATPSRAIGTAFQPSTSKWMLCIYTIQFVLAHGQAGVVIANCDTANPPTTPVGEAGGALVDDAATVTVTTQLVVLCPPGDFVKLVASGTGSPTIVTQQETAIN